MSRRGAFLFILVSSEHATTTRVEIGATRNVTCVIRCGLEQRLVDDDVVFTGTPRNDDGDDDDKRLLAAFERRT